MTEQSHVDESGTTGLTKRTNVKSEVQTIDDFVNRAIEVHGDRYEYTHVKFKGLYQKVLIICPIHGAFKQLPRNHLLGNGCKRCTSGKGGLAARHDTMKGITLYLAHCSDDQESFYKIGLTAVGVEARSIRIPYQVTSLFEYNFSDLSLASSTEAFLIKHYGKLRYKPAKQFYGSVRETFLFADIESTIRFTKELIGQQLQLATL
jgi:hypothetical protein